MAPTLILTQVTVATGDPRRPWATALAFDGGFDGTADGPLTGATLAAIGSAAEIQKLAGPDTRVLSGGGQSLTLPPGTTVGSRVQLTAGDDGRIVGISPVPLP